jgi:hypothetical protein
MEGLSDLCVKSFLATEDTEGKRRDTKMVIHAAPRVRQGPG